MLDKATNSKAKRPKQSPAVGAMPDSSGKITNLLQAEIKAREAPGGFPCFCHADGHPGATHALLEPAVQADEKGKDLAQVDFDNNASASSSDSGLFKSSVLAGSSSSQLIFDPLSSLISTGKRKAVTPVPADGNAAPIMVEVSETSEQPADPILHSSTSEKKFKSGEDDVKDYVQNRPQKILQDRPGHADLTPSMFAYLAKLPELTGEEQAEGEGEAADHLQVNEPPMGIGGIAHGVATFEAGIANQGGDRVLVPFLEMRQVDVDGLLQ